MTVSEPLALSDDEVIAAMQAWLEHAVIGLNLCPFAKAVQVKRQIHWVCSGARDEAGLMVDLLAQLKALAAANADVCETTLLIAPHCCADFLDFNAMLGRADRALHALELDGVLQIASFHPDYQFAGADAMDVTHCTNRAPFPTLHLLREASIDRAVAAYPQAETIYERNMETLTRMGFSGWLKLAQHWAVTPQVGP